MKTKIYYFSATGNCLYIAKKLSENIDNTELVSITREFKNKKINIKSNKIGFIVPVYAWGLPRIVEDFLKKITTIQADYIFGIASCAGTPGSTLKKLDKLIKKKGNKLNAGFVVTQKSYTLMESNLFMDIMIKIAGKMPETFNRRLDSVLDIIKSCQKHEIESSSKAANIFGAFIHKIALKFFKKAGKDFWVNDKCNNCGICVDICPRNNIKLIDKNPSWENNCEFCMACLQWCPQEAIEYQDISKNKKRIHNENVKIDDLIDKR